MWEWTEAQVGTGTEETETETETGEGIVGIGRDRGPRHAAGEETEDGRRVRGLEALTAVGAVHQVAPTVGAAAAAPAPVDGGIGKGGTDGGREGGTDRISTWRLLQLPDCPRNERPICSWQPRWEGAGEGAVEGAAEGAYGAIMPVN